MFNLGGNDVYVDSERFTRLNGDARIYIEMSPENNPLQKGTWRVELTGTEIRGGRFDAWIERDARDRTNGFADQSSFDGTDFDPTQLEGRYYFAQSEADIGPAFQQLQNQIIRLSK